MARVLNYQRPIDSIYEREIDGNLNLSKRGVQVKEEPFDSEINNETSSASTKHQNNKKSKYKSAKKMKALKEITCPICMNVLKSKSALEQHLERYKQQHACNTCNAVFIVLNSLKKHSRLCRLAGLPRSREINCNFCARTYKDKKALRSHLFHVHGNLISSGETEAKETLKKPNKSDGTSTNNLETPNSIPLKCLNSASLKKRSSLNTVPSMELDDSFDPASLNNVSTTSVNTSNDSYCPPTKKLKQTTLMDFISLHKSKPERTRVTRTNKEDVPISTSSPVTHKSREEVTSSTALDNQSEANRSSSKSPFVHIHVSPKTMLSLLNQEGEAQLDYRCLAYNLRPAKLISSSWQYCMSPSSSESSISFRASHGMSFSRKRKRCTRSSSSNQSVQSLDAQLKMRFKCKDCVILLNRCDEVVNDTNFESNESFCQDKFGNLKEENSAVNRLNLKTTKVPKLKFFEVEESVVSRLKSQEQSGDEDNVEEKKIFRCHVCRRSQPSKKNLREHVKKFHKIYISTICNARYTSMKKLVNHYLSQHILSRRKKCCVCYEKFDTTVLLKRHMMLHCVMIVPSKNDTLPVNARMNCITVKKQHKCKGCSKRFWLNSCLQQHEQVCSRMNVQKTAKSIVPIENPPQPSPSKSNERVPSSLTVEPPSSNSDSNVDLQESPSLPGSNEQPIQTFDLEAITQKDFNTETSSSSTPSENFTAPNDSVLNAYAQKKSLIKRITCVKGYQVNVLSKMKFPCNICGKQFHTFQNLCLHESTYCKPVTSFCNICGTAFTTKRLLQLHTLATHAPSCSERYRLFCRFCNQGFSKKSNLQIHERHFHIKHIPKPYLNSDALHNLNNPICGTCNLTFPSHERFIEHNMYYYKNQVFGCTICSKLFRGMYKLHHHNKLVHYPEHIRKSYAYTCNVCSIGFNYESHLHAHRCHVHAEDPSSNLSQQSTLQDHTYAVVTNNMVMIEESRQTPIKTYSCDVCNLNFTNPRDLASHKKEYFIESDVFCDKCDRCYNSSVLAQHYSLNHTGSDISDAFKCRYCGEVLTTITSMRCHEKHFHENNTSGSNSNSSNTMATKKLRYDVEPEKDDVHGNRCSTCGTTFSDKKALKKHLLEYSDIGEHRCNMCQRRFTDSHLLEQHKTNHSLFVLSSRRCPICNEGFPEYASIKTHILHLHRFETFLNNRSKSTVSVTNFSEAVESGGSSLNSSSVSSVLKKELIKCNDCKVAFNSRKDLMKHKSRFKNSGEYECSICGRRFPWLKMLKQHERKHLKDDDPLLKYKCPHCMEKFRRSVSLYSHVIHAHDSSLLTTQPSSDADGSKSNVQEGDDTNKTKTATTVTPLVTTTDTKETSELDMIDDTLDNADRYFSNTCHVCDVTVSTLSELETHFKTVHGKNVETSEANTVQSDVVTHSVISSTMANAEENKKKEDHCPIMQTPDQVSSSGQVEMENSDHSSNSVDSDVIQIVWDKKSKAIECVTIRDEEDEDIQIIANEVPLLDKQKVAALSKDIIVLNNVGKVRVRSFAKMMDDCEIVNA